MSFDDFIANLTPGVRKNIQTVSNVNRTVYKTPLVGLNWALDGGFLAGGFVTVYGGSGSSKSTLMLQCVALWQTQGYTCGIIDAEGTVTKQHAESLGVDVSRLIYSGDKGIRQAADTPVAWLEAGIDVVIVDTISDLIPAPFIDKDGTVKEFDGNQQIGASAKSIAAMTRMIHYTCKKNQLVIYVSQTTTEINTTYTRQIPSGGKKVEFDSSQMLQLTASRATTQQLKSKEDGSAIGREVTAVVMKNKGGPEYRTAKYNVYYGDGLRGIDKAYELVEVGCQQNVIQGTTWLSWNDIKAQGKENFARQIRDNPALMDALYAAVEMALDGVVVDGITEDA